MLYSWHVYSRVPALAKVAGCWVLSNMRWMFWVIALGMVEVSRVHIERLLQSPALGQIEKNASDLAQPPTVAWDAHGPTSAGRCLARGGFRISAGWWPTAFLGFAPGRACACTKAAPAYPGRLRRCVVEESSHALLASAKAETTKVVRKK